METNRSRKPTIGLQVESNFASDYMGDSLAYRLEGGGEASAPALPYPLPGLFSCLVLIYSLFLKTFVKV